MAILFRKGSDAGKDVNVHAELCRDDVMIEGKIMLEFLSNSLVECVGKCGRSSNCSTVVYGQRDINEHSDISEQHCTIISV